MTSARKDILERIRSALHDVPSTEAPGDVVISRDYHTTTGVARDTIVSQFIERVGEYKATVHSVTPDELAAAIAQACAARNVRRLVVPHDIPGEWLPAGVDALRDLELTYEQLGTSDGVLTGCALAIAQTGTIVLDAGAYQGRRALSLLPDYHLCIVRAGQVVGTVPEAISALGQAVREARRPLTFISGPSATSDIELNRVEGVHGPRTLEVIVVALP